MWEVAPLTAQISVLLHLSYPNLVHLIILGACKEIASWPPEYTSLPYRTACQFLSPCS